MEKKHVVLAVVKFNSGEALVLRDRPELCFLKKGDVIVGTDGTFCSCYFYKTPGVRWEAFGGRKFDIQLANGEVEHCYGQWWDGVKEQAVKILGERPIHVTANDIQSLSDCYVFFGYTALPGKYKELRDSYKGVIWNYRDYEAMITRNKYLRKRGMKWLKPYRNQLRKRSLLTSITTL